MWPNRLPPAGSPPGPTVAPQPTAGETSSPTPTSSWRPGASAAFGVWPCGGVGRTTLRGSPRGRRLLVTEHEKAVGRGRPDADALRAQAEPAELREQSPQGGDDPAADRDRQA